MITVTKENMEAIKAAAQEEVTVEEVAAYLEVVDGGSLSGYLGDCGQIEHAVKNKSDYDTARDIAMTLYVDHVQDLAITEWENAFAHFDRKGGSD